MDLASIYHENIPDFLLDAASAPVMQRLRGVGMNCGCEYTAFPQFACWQPYSRFDHSLGAALIVWHFTGDIHQAMAALLHDIATPVFSHVVDFLRGDYLTQESTEDGTAERILQSAELLRVFQTYSITPERVTDYHRYPIADNDPPRLSADRLEYTLGNIVNFGYGTRETVRTYYADLLPKDGELVFSTPAIAEAFARDALRCGKVYVSDADRFSMEYLAELLRAALSAGVLTETDFYLREQDVIQKLEESTLRERWMSFRELHALQRYDTPAPERCRIFAKKRYIDPAVTDGRRASAFSAVFARELADFRNYSFDYWLK